jgi:hypothetical protein
MLSQIGSTKQAQTLTNNSFFPNFFDKESMNVASMSLIGQIIPRPSENKQQCSTAP